jgi:AcrR family transcriptional regulator
MHARGRPITLSDDALLDVARAVFVERGIDATTSTIAKRARISESVIFYRYKTKEALFAAVFEREMVIPAAFAKLAWRAGTGAIADNLFDAGMGLVELSGRVLPLMMIALGSPTKLKAVFKHARAPHPLRTQMVNLLVRYFDQEQRAGRLRKTSSETLARAFLGGITQFVMSAQIEEVMAPELDAPTYVRGMIDLLLHGAIATGSRHRAARPARRRR